MFDTGNIVGLPKSLPGGGTVIGTVFRKFWKFLTPKCVFSPLNRSVFFH